MVNADARDRLLSAAMSVVLTHGWDVSNRDLAAAIGTSHRMLDYYFGGRQPLMAAVLDGLSTRLMASFDEVPSTDDGPRNLMALAELDGDPALAALWLEVLLRALRGQPEYAAAARRVGGAWHAWLRTNWDLDADRADAVLAAFEGSGVVAVARGEAAGKAALRRLLAALDNERR